MTVIAHERATPTFPLAVPPATVVRPARIDVSVVVVTWNSQGWIERCIRSIRSACGARSFEIIVQDNASVDATLSIVGRMRDDKVKILTSPRNRGFAGGINLAIAQSRGEYIFLLNPDCEPAPDSISRLIEYLEKKPQVAAAVPLLLDDKGAPQREFQLRRLPTLGSLVAEILLIKEIFPDNSVSARYRYRELDISTSQPVEQPAAAALLIRKEVVEAIGPFDESFAPAWFEDVDYCRRLAEQKLEINLVPTAVATHYGGASLEHVRYEDFLSVWYRNLFRYARKWMKTGEVEALRWTIIVGMLLRSVAAFAGLRNPRMNGGSARGYLTIARQAFERWPESEDRPDEKSDTV